MDAFHNVRFPVDISFGATGGPERRNEIVLLTSGNEKRNARFAHSRRRYDAGTGIRSLADLQAIVAFFEARRGSLHGFRFRDPFDMKSCAPADAPGAFDQTIGTGDGATAAFQLVKTYGTGEDAYARPITRPRSGTVKLAVDGQVLTAPNFSVNHQTGMVTLQPNSIPPPGRPVTAGYEFDVPVRFDTERLEVSIAAFNAGQIPSIPIVEIRS